MSKTTKDNLEKLLNFTKDEKINDARWVDFDLTEPSWEAVDEWMSKIRKAEFEADIAIQIHKKKSEVFKGLLNERSRCSDDQAKKIDSAFDKLNKNLDNIYNKFEKLLKKRKETIEVEYGSLGAIAYRYSKTYQQAREKYKEDSKAMIEYDTKLENLINEWSSVQKQAKDANGSAKKSKK